MKIKLDGWDRIGIVIWIVGFLGLWIWQCNDAGRYHEELMKGCEASYARQNQEIRSTKFPSNADVSKLYDNTSRAFGECMDRALSMAKPRYEEAHTWTTVVVSAVYSLLAFLIPYSFVVVTLKWIVRGFTPSPKDEAKRL